MNPGETRGDACVTDAPSLPCSAVHRASWKLPERERERDQVPTFSTVVPLLERVLIRPYAVPIGISFAFPMPPSLLCALLS